MDEIATLRATWQAQAQESVVGWDWSRLDGRMLEQPLPWDYRQIVAAHLRQDDELLDMGTGGGEFLLSLHHPYARTCVTEAWPPNVDLIRRHLTPLGVTLGVTGADDHLPFADGRFDVVLNRHESFDAAEVARVLRRGGVFVTQQVGASNGRDLAVFLLRDAPTSEHTLAACRTQLESAGLTVLQAQEAFPTSRFTDVGAIVWYASTVGWEFPGFSVDACLDRLLALHARCEHGETIPMREHRFLLVARLPGI
ncbi:MAG: class I SAM-dependent methyltransferase [Propionibacteriaceae bacterium]|nr:class I SAM-dependent methyltransferase [Propionibacteriaceae bacterium]